MKLISLRLSASAIITRIFISILALSAPAFAQQPLREAFQYDNFEIREEMVPMRDGVKLYTLILAPKNSTEPPLPILIKRTPYDATGALSGHSSSRLDGDAGQQVPRRRLHLRLPGHPRPFQIGGRLRDVPGAAWRVQQDGDR